MRLFETFDGIDPKCKHKWYQLPYAISALVERCELCRGRRWVHFTEELE